MISLAGLSLAVSLASPVLDDAADVRVSAEPGQLGAALRARGLAHPETRFDARSRPAAGGGRLMMLRERLAGVPIAGARIAVRIDSAGVIRRVVGRALDVGQDVGDASARLRVAAVDAGDARLVWWPTPAGLRLARVVDDPLRWLDGAPTRARRYVDVASGRELAQESLVDALSVPLAGWLENPLTTPTPQVFDVELLEQAPIALEDDVFRVLQCNWSAALEGCEPLVSPTAAAPDDFPSDLPALDDALTHASRDDPYAATHLAAHASRFLDALASWGWDSYAWDEIDCSVQDVEPANCRLLLHANVLAQDGAAVVPFAGAFYSRGRGVYMGQGYNADTSYDGDIIVHEIGHHVVWSFGAAEPVDLPDDGARRRVDWGALNEGSADVFASLMGQNERVYDYFSAIEPGSYVDHRVRDVGIPFRCPQNIVGEVHMEGRIWVSAIHSVRLALADAGLADRDAFAAAWLTALGLIRHVPREYGELFADASVILVDELRVAFGDEAGDIAQAIVDERGLSACEHVLDVRDEVTLPDARDDPLDARFMVFTSHKTTAALDAVDQHPFAPPLQHRVTLGPDEDGVRVRGRPGLWGTAQPDAPPSFRLGLLARVGDEGVRFARDPDSKLSSNDAELRFASSELDEDGWIEVTAAGLTPGETYSLALVSLSPVDGDTFVLEDIRWQLLPADPAGDSDDLGEDTGEDGEIGTDAGGGAGEGEGGCGCRLPEGSRAPPWWALALARTRRRRRVSLAAGAGRTTSPSSPDPP